MRALDKILHDPIRLKIILKLVSTSTMGFYELKGLTNTTDGNLATHLRSLENSGYISVSKTYEGRRVKTLYAITEEGNKALNKHLSRLRTLIDLGRNALRERRAASCY